MSHKATPEQWEDAGAFASDTRACLLELRDRITALEQFRESTAAHSLAMGEAMNQATASIASLEQRVKALEGPAAEAAELRAALQQENQRRLAQEASAPAAAPAPDGESEYTDAEWSEIQRFTAPAAAPAPAPPMSLVDAVEARAGGDARSAIHEVADWLQLRHTGRIANGSQFAEVLRQEAER